MRAPARRLLFAAITAAGLSAALTLPATAGVAPDSLVSVTKATGTAVPGQYIVTVKKGVSAKSPLSALGVTASRTFSTVLNGFSAKLSAQQLSALQRNPAVTAIEQDQVVNVDTTQSNPVWGLDRIDQRALPLSKTYTYTATASNVHAYVIDTGIDVTHPDFEGRATADFNAFGGPNVDCNGHGTHVAGTIGSETYGVAKNVRLHAVRWLNCAGAGNLSGAIAAVDFVTANAQRPAVANTSWNFGWSDTLAAALTAMMDSGVFLATSAGNTGANSCDRLPRGLTATLAVGATTITDTRAGFSSTGPCVDIYAPGASILSTQPGNTTALFSGTSMATPHAAGVAVLYKDEFGDANQATLSAYLTNTATKGVVQGNLVDTPNRLLFSSPEL